ncbi:hypothetical protein [[Phormidium ambiguum] IAM M-71]|uniref:hypothetical protein n=1 Tax=[Phormidium ambiguum] IAM M-71 TaxID=454136 RepID=UPI0011610039|nr:hypothetical protein [Phormidium ambiguum]
MPQAIRTLQVNLVAVKAEGRRQKAEGRRQKGRKVKILLVPLSPVIPCPLPPHLLLQGDRCPPAVLG